jgi:hypothetical protein
MVLSRREGNAWQRCALEVHDQISQSGSFCVFACCPIWRLSAKLQRPDRNEAATTPPNRGSPSEASVASREIFNSNTQIDVNMAASNEPFYIRY